jgi:hypothetical protein
MNEKTFELLSQMYGEIRQGFSNVNNRIDSMDKRIDDLGKQVAKLEYRHGEKLEALFDGYKTNSGAIHELREDVRNLAASVERHEVKLNISK